MTIRMPSLPQPTARLRATLLASPIQASVWPSSLPTSSRIVYRSAKRLAGVAEIGQAVDHRASAMLGEIDGRLVAVGADHDHVGVLAQHAGEIGHALAAAETRLVARERSSFRQGGPCRPRSSRGSAARASRTAGPSRGPAAAARAAPSSYLVLRSSVIEKMRSISAAVKSASVNRCRIMLRNRKRIVLHLVPAPSILSY